jgi:hypothetical protein
MMALSTEQVTWYSVRMQMQDTSAILDPAAEQVHISTSWKTIQLHASMVRS